MNTKNIFVSLILLGLALPLSAQRTSVRDEIRADWNLCSGLDCVYDMSPKAMSPVPKGYEPFYVSHYGRHGSRFAYTARAYETPLRMLAAADSTDNLTDYGKQLYAELKPFVDTVLAHTGDLTPLGWEQHQYIARTMAQSFPAAFKGKSRVDACASPKIRSIISMGSFCTSLARTCPNVSIYQHQGIAEMQVTAPNRKDNPIKYTGPANPFPYGESADEFLHRRFPGYKDVLGKIFKDPETGLGGRTAFKAMFVFQLLVGGMNSVPANYRANVGGIFDKEQYAQVWECCNYDSFREYNAYKTPCSNIWRDMVLRSDKRLASGEKGADLRFGHDHCLMTLLMIADVEDFGTIPANPDDLCLYFQTFRSPMAGNLQMVFYAPKGWAVKKAKGCAKAGEPEFLVKLLLNGEEVRFGKLETAQGPYYKWSVLRDYLLKRIALFLD